MPTTRILVVESEAEVRDVIAGFLQRKGHVVQAVADGAAARAVLAGPPPDAVVLRITLADGLAPALVRLMAESEPPRPGLVLTGSKASADDFVRRVDCGGARILLKPFGGAELLRSVEEALAQSAFPSQISMVEAPSGPSSLAGWAPSELDADFGSLLSEAGSASIAKSPPQPMGPGFPPAASSWPEPPPASPVFFRVPETGAVGLLPPQVVQVNAAKSQQGQALEGSLSSFESEGAPPDASEQGDWIQVANEVAFGSLSKAPASDHWALDSMGGVPPANVMIAPVSVAPDAFADDFGMAFGVPGNPAGNGSAESMAGAPAWAAARHPRLDGVEGLPLRPVEDERGLRLQPMVGEEAHDPRGIYGEVRLAEVLVRCHRDRFTGRLVLMRGPVRKIVNLVDGRMVGGRSNLRGESLRTVIAERGLVDLGSLAALQVPDQDLPQALVGAGMLTQPQADALRQARLIGALLECFGWTGGQYGLVYDPAEADRACGLPVEVPPLVLRGLTEVTPLAPITQFFDGRARESVRTTLQFDKEQVGLGLSGDLALFVQTFDGRRTVSELLALSPIGISGTLRLLRALAELGCVSLGSAGAPGFEGLPPRLITGQPGSLTPAPAVSRTSSRMPVAHLDEWDEARRDADISLAGGSIGPSPVTHEGRYEAVSGMPSQVNSSFPIRGESAPPARSGIHRSGPTRSAIPSHEAQGSATQAVRPPSAAVSRRAEPALRPLLGSPSSAGTARSGLDQPSATRSSVAPVSQRSGLLRPSEAAPRGSSDVTTGGQGSVAKAAAPTAGSRTTAAPAGQSAEGRQATQAAAPPASPARLKALLEAKHAALGTVDHYTLLELPREATAEDVGAAYRKLSRDIHQAATHEPRLFDKATEVGRALAEAAQILSDRRKRAQYDAVTLGNLAGPALEIDVPGAEAAFARGKACLERRDLPEAYEHFDRAMRLDSSQSLYRMYAAFARFRLSYPKHRKAAVEAHEALKSALLDDGSQDEGFQLMAQIYRDTGNKDLAARFYRKALSINRNNRLAQEGLAALGHGDELQASGVFGRLFGRK